MTAVAIISLFVIALVLVYIGAYQMGRSDGLAKAKMLAYAVRSAHEHSWCYLCENNLRCSAIELAEELARGDA